MTSTTTVDAGGEVSVAFCLHAQQLTKSGFAGVFGPTNGYRERLGGKPLTSPPASLLMLVAKSLALPPYPFVAGPTG